MCRWSRRRRRRARSGPHVVAEHSPRADAAWDELQALRAEAAALGVDVDEAWPIDRLRTEIATAKAAGNT